MQKPHTYDELAEGIRKKGVLDAFRQYKFLLQKQVDDGSSTPFLDWLMNKGYFYGGPTAPFKTKEDYLAWLKEE